MNSMHNRFLDRCVEMAGRSKDPNTRVGSLIVSRRERVITTGFNHLPRGIEETPSKWHADLEQARERLAEARVEYIEVPE